MSRWKAAGIHLLISAAIVGCVLVFLLLTFYPPAIMGISKSSGLIIILGAVDIVIGPLLTLLVYKAGKSSLKFDLSVIALLQLGALAYGLYTIWQTRPVFIVANNNTFNIVYANEIEPADLALSKNNPHARFSFTGPSIVGLKPHSTSPDEMLSQFIQKQPNDDSQLQNKPQFYIAYDDVAKTLAADAKVLKADEQSPEKVINAIKAFATSKNYPLPNCVFVPIISSRGSGVMLLDKQSGKMLEPANINPWGAEEVFTKGLFL
jgi:hypothetical protein